MALNRKNTETTLSLYIVTYEPIPNTSQGAGGSVPVIIALTLSMLHARNMSLRSTGHFGSNLLHVY